MKIGFSKEWRWFRPARDAVIRKGPSCCVFHHLWKFSVEKVLPCQHPTMMWCYSHTDFDSLSFRLCKAHSHVLALLCGACTCVTTCIPATSISPTRSMSGQFINALGQSGTFWFAFVQASTFSSASGLCRGEQKAIGV